MKKMVFLFMLFMGVLFCSNPSVARADELSENEVYIEIVESEKFTDQEMSTFMYVYGSEPTSEGLARNSRATNDYEIKEMYKTMYVNDRNDEGYRVTLYAIRLYIKAYFYPDGKVHMNAFGYNYFIYDNDVELFFNEPKIYNTDGSYSIGSVCYVHRFRSGKYDAHYIEASAMLIKNSKDAVSKLDVLL
ncbi:MAG: hypothetical protein E7260_04005 [Lachnospiraceae bacterium]|nr:hypothetical protein [Lachnospiraceae bacterium]